MDGPEAGTVAGSHVLVERLNGVGTGELTELLVHVVCAGAGVVAEPDTEVIDLQWLLLADLIMQYCRCEVRNERRNDIEPMVSLPFRLPLERLQGTTCRLYVQR